ncbi:hypothetical protein, partial [Burkholderia pseudomallei]|uniref:hypothetical protein n=1 Tax=Burkholderia pseudomallei TaxID=28450 RepID=UPI00292E9D0F
SRAPPSDRGEPSRAGERNGPGRCAVRAEAGARGTASQDSPVRRERPDRVFALAGWAPAAGSRAMRFRASCARHACGDGATMRRSDKATKR